MARLDIEIDDTTHARAKAAAALRRISLKEYVTLALTERLERDERPRGRNGR